jgi:hypothetical protein
MTARNYQRGEMHSSAKLTDDAVREIRTAGKPCACCGRPASVYQIAKRYGVSHVTIWKILNNLAWSHVQ